MESRKERKRKRKSKRERERDSEELREVITRKKKKTIEVEDGMERAREQGRMKGKRKTKKRAKKRGSDTWAIQEVGRKWAFLLLNISLRDYDK